MIDLPGAIERPGVLVPGLHDDHIASLDMDGAGVDVFEGNEQVGLKHWISPGVSRTNDTAETPKGKPDPVGRIDRLSQPLEAPSFMRIPLAVVAIFLLAMGGHGQSPAKVAKDQRVTLRIPAAAFVSVNEPGYSYFESLVAKGDTGIAVFKGADWRGVGLTLTETMKVVSVKIEKKRNLVEVKLDRKKGADMYVMVPVADTAAVFSQVFAAPEDSALVHRVSREMVQRALFTGSWSSATAGTQRKFLDIIEELAIADSVTTVTFQGKSYLQLHAPESGSIYNEGMTSEPQREAGVLNEVAFPLARALGQVDTSLAVGLGFSILADINSKTTLDPVLSVHRERMALFIPADVAGQFARAEITSQELIDKSVVLVRGNRVKIDLTK